MYICANSAEKYISSDCTSDTWCLHICSYMYICANSAEKMSDISDRACDTWCLHMYMFLRVNLRELGLKL